MLRNKKKGENLYVYLFFTFLTFFRITSTAVNYLKYLQMINLVKYYGDTEQHLYTHNGKNPIRLWKLQSKIISN